jgi:RimJ/RimL family protein N-acetyltransferase
MPLPSFKTDRLLARPRCFKDLNDCLRMDRDPQVTRFIKGPWSDPSEHRKFVLDRIKHSYPDGFGYWSVMNIESRQFLGWILLLPYTAVKNEVEIGWRFTRENCKRFSNNTEALR